MDTLLFMNNQQMVSHGLILIRSDCLFFLYFNFPFDSAAAAEYLV